MGGLGAGSGNTRVHHAGAALVGWMELVWVRGLGLTDVALAAQLKCLDSAPICTIKMGGGMQKKKRGGAGPDWYL